MPIKNLIIPSIGHPDLMKANVQTLADRLFEEQKISVDVLRLDKIHTIISGNKWFKLKYYLQEVIEQGKKGIITFGGPYSNHLVATAYACKQAGLSSIGVIHGEEPVSYSPTLRDMQSYGMHLVFTSRKFYNNTEFKQQLADSYPGFLLVEEGGRGRAGVRGAEEILQLISLEPYSHIMCAVGTGTMLSGIINSAQPTQSVVGISAVKLVDRHKGDIMSFINDNTSARNFAILNDFHFGGYAKKSPELIQFMNRFYEQHEIPSDFVYTGKLFYAVIKLTEKNYYKAGDKILVIHSGGLQGNRSLPNGTLIF